MIRKQKAVGHHAGSVVAHSTMEEWIKKAEKLEDAYVNNTTPFKDNYYYLKGFADGYGGEEPHGEFPEGFSNINEIWARIYELKEQQNLSEE